MLSKTKPGASWNKKHPLQATEKQGEYALREFTQWERLSSLPGGPIRSGPLRSYSARNARIGSMEAARKAGASPAMAATKASTAAIVMRRRGSKADTP